MQEQIIALSQVSTTICVLIGILISLILPVAVNVLKDASTRLEGKKRTLGTRIQSAWKRYGGNRYLIIFFAAVFIAIVMVLLLELEFFKVRDAVLAGFAWESLVNKLFRQQGKTPSD